MRRCLMAVVACVPFVALSCFPIELDATKDGKLLISRGEGFFLFNPADGKAVKILGSEMGAPIYARVSPNGKDALAVTKSSEGFNSFQFLIAPLSGDGKPKPIFKGENALYARFSPDGSQLAITIASEKEDPDLKERVPEIQVVSTSGGKAKVAAKKVGLFTRWFSDSKRLLVFEVQKKDDSGKYYGNISTVDVSSGKATKLASAVVEQQFYFDLSPDNKQVSFIAYSAGKGGATLPEPESFEKTLFQLDVAGGKLTETKKAASYAIYSPDGKSLLMGVPAGGFSFDSVVLEVASAADPKTGVTVAKKVYKPISFGTSAGTFPGWADNDTVYYFVQKEVYGSEAKSVNLVLVGKDGAKRKNVQPLIDTAVGLDEEE